MVDGILRYIYRKTLALTEIHSDARGMLRFAFSLCFLTAFSGAVVAEPLKVASMHPLIGDLLRQVGGEKLLVVDLIGAKGDPHSFEPQAKDLAAALLRRRKPSIKQLVKNAPVIPDTLDTV